MELNVVATDTIRLGIQCFKILLGNKQHGAGSLLTTNDEAIVALSVSKGEKQLFPGLLWE